MLRKTLDGRSTSGTAALKVQRSAQHYTEAAKDEIEILKQLKSADPSGAEFVVQLLDNFVHTGPNGLPVGVQLAGRFAADDELLSVAAWAEGALAAQD